MKKFSVSLLMPALLTLSRFVCAADSTGPRMLALASDAYLTEQVGQYDPKLGWIQNDRYLDRPLQGTVYTLIGISGKLAEVKTVDHSRLDSETTPWAWFAEISPWPRRVQPQALAIKGSWPAPERPAKPIPLEDPASVSAVSDFLKLRKLNVPQPYLTEAYSVDLLGDGHEEKILCAHNDATALVDTSSATVYALVLMVFDVDGKKVTRSLEAYAAYKPANRRLEDQEDLYGVRPFYRLIAFPDLTGDGRLEIAFTKNLFFKPSTYVDAFDGRSVKHVLAGYIVEQ